ncbi:Putative forkhead-associated (FHA) domain, SMAD/FHA domain superfamily [Septoria linicola]|uniref:Forkhead-associated (FHA) domain, SMAD/FHA domain superfamily n=1 Tax=Septoria linicola TaxID=215465 RepID=A0A9Q9B6R4_9PEZI|nr:putative forkhead-associated (FHA) domain, SMAD/FHA domain superfamily [Septoria linicola]USW59275.1 Putative forkhead-associated (FHA) domain, SMAD/FHA domain superfamily [Septoria linicola]
MESGYRSRRYGSDDELRAGKDRAQYKRRDRSPLSEDERSPRRRRHADRRDERSPAGAQLSAQVSDSGDEPSRHRRKHDRDDRNERRRRDRRDRSQGHTEDERRSSRHLRKHRERSESRDRNENCRSRRRHASRSPKAKRRKSRSASPPAFRKSRAPLPSQDESFRGELPPGEKPVEKQKPNFKPTGLLAKEANTVAGTTTVLKYHEPPEARKPSSKEQWRMYVFKKQDLLDTIQLHTRSAWLVGRDQKITDLFLEHPSISKQHAVIQFRHRTSTNEYGDKSSKVKPYLIDLDSANGTKLNGKRVEASRYMELLDQDIISFGDSEREYVMMLPGAEK